mmetsp:Transcript_6233/g.9485  ORF Transcript_6233/g.9485 Transcript_6233/m.9485 type:complete len:210 (+) Transcript_6233:95-724(+)|eukprot:CAMPEP_0118711230 /NCGR_PEP_ID=MMETSP0800-20121206/23948_1 /TAXON_ID=210618 ORGANISM="Striatella unipunctata, Strain CCMP2910" /NCGR_SAMPLE_ID=MMETSP0800 /ASSEMBLY_ACC=CAM_ASM_000638 /LENGTH=209 /DNA_ID=CAMNT_0006615753 /DNA_START=73 /DNA_END=702 /DNA_ORIENTATION=-
MASKAKGIKIPVHVAAFSAASLPAFLYVLYYRRNALSKEELETELSRNYATNIQQSRQKRKDMEKFFEKMKNSADSEMANDKMSGLLHAGKGESMKRLHAIDTKYYGTEEGLKKKEELEEASKKEGPKKYSKVFINGPSEAETKESKIAVVEKKKKKKKRKEKAEQPVVNSQEPPTTEGLDGKKVAGIITAVGVSAAVAGFVIGGNQRR